MKKKSLLVELPEDLHKTFKLKCLQDDTTMREVVVARVTEYVGKAIEPSTPPKPKANPRKPATKQSHTPEELEVFEHWKVRMGKSNNAKLNGKRKANLKARLSEGYSVEYIKQAIDGCAKSAHHMGRNDQGTVYDDLELICRTSEKLEWFAESVGKVVPMKRPEEMSIKESMAASSQRAQETLESGFLDDIF